MHFQLRTGFFVDGLDEAVRGHPPPLKRSYGGTGRPRLQEVCFLDG
jgi:hypothetical protein